MHSDIEFGMPVDYEVQQQVKLLFMSVLILVMRDWSLILVIEMRCDGWCKWRASIIFVQ